MDKKRTDEEYQQQLRLVDDANCLRAINQATTKIGSEDFTRRKAIKVLEYAADFSDEREWPKELRKYLADCIDIWLETNCDPKKSAIAFNVQRPAHRIKSNNDKYVKEKMRAVRAFYLMKGRKKGYDYAIEAGMRVSKLSKSTVKGLVKNPLETLEGAATFLWMREKNLAVANRCFLKPHRKKYKKLY